MKRVLVCVLKFCVHVKSVCVYVCVCVLKSNWVEMCVKTHTFDTNMHTFHVYTHI
jgi:hypothetical protein